jgi:CHAT domain-containing protein
MIAKCGPAAVLVGAIALMAFQAAPQSPDSLREAFRLRLARAASAGPARAGAALDSARSIAQSYARDWRDSILLRQLGRFERWSARERAIKVAADSLRHAGFEIFPRSGAPAAIPLWQASLRHAASIADSAGLAATSGNLGAAFLSEGDLDSASVYLGRARRFAAATADWRTLGNALGSLGSLEKSRGNYPAARAMYGQALAARERSGDDRGAAADENNLGLVAQELHDTAGARRFFTAALTRNRAARRAGPAATNLSNLAMLAIAGGDHRAAAGLYREALALHRGARESAGAGLDLRNLGGVALRQGDYPAAITALSASVALLDSTGPAADAVGARGDLAQAFAATGELGRAASIIDSADTASLDGDPSLLASLAVLRGDFASDAGAFDDATAAYARADSLYTLAGDAAGSAAARQGLGVLQLRSGDPTGAARTLRAAQRVERDAGDNRAAALTGILIGAADGERGAPADAAAGLRHERAALHRLGDPVGEAAAFNALGDVEQRAGHARAAEAAYRAGLRAVGTRTAPAVETSLRWGLGRALRAEGHLEGAVDQLPLAVNAMETMATRMPAGEHRTSLLGNASTLYAELALTEHQRGRDGVAFETSERLRARQMRELAPSGDGGTSVPPPAGVDRAAIASRLRTDEALLEYLVTDSVTLLFVVTRDTARAIEIPAGRGELRAAVDFARSAIARGPARSVPEPWSPPMRRLYRLLIAPARATGLLSGVHRLLIVPHAELHYLPFAALMAAGSSPYLVEHYDIAYIPSAEIWLQLGRRAPVPAGRSVLAFAPFPRSLPGSHDEATAIGRLYGPDATVITGPAATRPAFRSAIPGRSIIHLATYGVLNRRNPAFSFVAFAPDSGAAGRLNVGDVLDLPVRARLVVLSACETALGAGQSADVPAGDDWVGLVRAFLLAGADEVMASLWPIEDRATARIIPTFYENLQRMDPVAALAGAQREALRHADSAAPRQWAAFVVVGGAQSGTPLR